MKQSSPIPMVTGVPDPIQAGIKKGWRVYNAANLPSDNVLQADIIIIGTGAGGGTAAEIFAKAGLRVLMLEEGKLQSSNHFDMDERNAYRNLYQESAGRTNVDGAMTILQGRCVGGSTVVNWTTSFRTPANTLKYWQQNFDVKGASVEAMAPWFENMEARLNIRPWEVPPNQNNEVLSKGSKALGIDAKTISRNVSGCWNLGYCGTGCPTNAKQSMLVTTIPSALDQQATLLYQARAERLIIEGRKVLGIEVTALNSNNEPTGSSLLVKAPQVVMACGGINGPALLLRSEAPDPHKRIGKRTFLHPVAFSFARFDDTIAPYYGAPQSIYSDHYQWQHISGPAGYKIEAAPFHPGLAAVLFSRHGYDHFQDMANLPNTNLLLSLIRDGFHPDSPGASITLADDGSPVVNYPLNNYITDGFRRAFISMAEIQFAAGANAVRPSHVNAPWYQNIKNAREGINALEFLENTYTAGSAHVMGGLAMGEDFEQCAVDSNGKYHHLDNLHVMDGSVFPTSIGANPQLSIYGFANKFATKLARKLVNN